MRSITRQCTRGGSVSTLPSHFLSRESSSGRCPTIPAALFSGSIYFGRISPLTGVEVSCGRINRVLVGVGVTEGVHVIEGVKVNVGVGVTDGIRVWLGVIVIEAVGDIVGVAVLGGVTVKVLLGGKVGRIDAVTCGRALVVDVNENVAPGDVITFCTVG